MIIGRTYNNISIINYRSICYNLFCLIIINIYCGNILFKNKFHSQFFCQTVHAINNGIHSFFRIPCTQFNIGIVHQAVQSRGIFRQCPQEQHRKFHQLPQLGVLKVFSNVFLHGGKHIKFKNTLYCIPIQELHHRLARFINKLIDANLIFIGRFF